MTENILCVCITAMAFFGAAVSVAAEPATFASASGALSFTDRSDRLLLPFKDGTRGILNGETFSVAWGDANGNAYPDLYLNHHHRWAVRRKIVPESHLFLDPGMPGENPAFQELPGFDQHAAIFIDVNGDGIQDLFEATGGETGTAKPHMRDRTRNQVFLGTGQAMVPENTVDDYGLAYDLGRTYHVVPVPIDGQLGLYLGTLPREDGQYPSTLMVRGADGTFVPRPDLFHIKGCEASGQPDCAARAAALVANFRTVVPGYFNADDRVDLAMILGFEQPGTLMFLGQPNGGFETDGQILTDQWTNDAAVLDIDNDGRFELWLTGLSGEPDQYFNALFACCGPDGPKELTGRLARSAGVRRGMSLVSGDFDNDMDIDVITYEKSPDHGFAFSIWENDGSGHFNPSPVGDPGNRGVASQVAVADYNLDGALDLACSDGGEEFGQDPVPGRGYVLLEGIPTSNAWLEVDLLDPWHLNGLGARVEVTAGGVTMVRAQFGGVHREGQDMTRLHFGLGPNERADLRVRWPDGRESELRDVAVNQIVTLRHPDGP